MENIIFSANIILPILVVMVVGQIARRVGWLDQKAISTGNNIAFKVFLPILLFNNVYTSDFSSLNTVGLLIFVGAMVIISFALATIFVVFVEKDNRRRGVMIQGMARTNYAMFGIPLLTLVFEGQDVAMGAVLIAVVIPLYNIITVIVLTYFGKKNASFKLIFMEILKNPLIIGTVTGLIFVYFNIKLPGFLLDAVSDLADVATPYSIFLLGAAFEITKIKKFTKQLVMVVITRLVVFPTLILAIAVMLGFRGIELGCVMIVFASPTAASSYTMAEKMGGDGELASAIVIFTSAFCVFSIFFIILALKTFALI